MTLNLKNLSDFKKIIKPWGEEIIYTPEDLKYTFKQINLSKFRLIKTKVIFKPIIYHTKSTFFYFNHIRLTKAHLNHSNLCTWPTNKVLFIDVRNTF